MGENFRKYLQHTIQYFVFQLQIFYRVYNVPKIMKVG